MRSSLLSALLVVLLLLALGATAEPVQPEAPPAIPLQRDLRFVIRPTVLGLVPPGDPRGFGECFVRVTAVGPSDVQARYEIKEAEPDPATLESSRPREVTRIRRGEVSASLELRRFETPLYWGDGSWASDSALLWLAPAAYAELASAGSTTFELGPPAGDDPLRSALHQLIEARRAQYGLGPTDPARLIIRDWVARYPVIVNGQRFNLPALRCTDSIELAEYWILADPANPLLLKLTLQAPGLDALEQAGNPAAALIAQGSGFAVQSIDY